MTVTYDTPQHQKAADTFDEYSHAVDAVHSDPTLSADGIRIKLAKLYTKARDTLNGLYASYQSGNQAQREALEKELFGLPLGASTADTFSYRDALSRTKEIADDSKALIDLLEMAALSSDSILAKAILAQAYATRQIDVINEYINDYPKTDEKLNTLMSLSTPSNAFIDMMPFRITPPSELLGLSDSRLDELASR